LFPHCHFGDHCSIGIGGGVLLLAIMALANAASGNHPVHGMVQLGSMPSAPADIRHQLRVILWFPFCPASLSVGLAGQSVPGGTCRFPLVQAVHRGFNPAAVLGPAIPR